MTITKHYCDHCAELIESDRTALKVRCGPERNKRDIIDLCSTCLHEWTAWLDARASDSTAPSPRRKSSKTAAEKANGHPAKATAAR